MNKEKFITFFVERRKNLGYSQSKIANDLGISDQAVSNWERGISFPDLTYLDNIAKLLQTNVYSLIEGKSKNIKIKENVTFDIQRFSLYLSKLRKEKKLTQNELGKILGVSGQNISKFENGIFLPSIELIEKYAQYFNVSILNIYYGLNDEALYDDIIIKENNNKNKKVYLIPCIIIIFVIALLLLPNLLIKKHTVTVIMNENEVITYEIKDKKIFTLPDLPTKKGYDASWDTLDTLITEDKTFTVIYTPKKYTITYSFENEEIENYVQEVTYGEEYELYTIDNEYFIGYTYNNKPFESGIYDYDYNILVIAKFNDYRTVTIVLDKDNIQTFFTKINTRITLPDLPTKKGYDASWDTLDTLITADKTFTVIYTPKKYTITYSFESEEIENYVQEVTYGEEYELYTIDNEYFIGYTYNNKPFESGIYDYDYNILVIAKFNNYRNVTIVLDKDNIQTFSTKINTRITLPDLPTKKGYDASWDTLDTLITADKTFTVIYTPKKYTITYVYENDIIETFTEEVSYGEKYNLFIPQLSNCSFVGYTYNDTVIENGVYEYDHNITIYGTFSNESYTIKYEFTNAKLLDTAYYGSLFLPNDYKLSDYLGECLYSPEEYSNYKIVAWKDNEGNIYEVGKSYLYNNKYDLHLCPIFEYYGNAFKVVIENDAATIVGYDISKITNLVIPDYIVVNGNRYKVTEIASKTFQKTYFMNISFSSNITKISKNTFRYDDGEYYVNPGDIYYRGTLEQWFNIEFEEYIVSNSSKSSMRLSLSSFLVGEQNHKYSIMEIPEEIEVIKSYSCAHLAISELVIPNSVQTIEEHAFIYSVTMRYVNIENVKNVHENAFN